MENNRFLISDDDLINSGSREKYGSGQKRRRYEKGNDSEGIKLGFTIFLVIVFLVGYLVFSKTIFSENINNENPILKDSIKAESVKVDSTKI